MFLTWKGVMRNCGIRRVVRILLRRGHFSDGGHITGKMPKIAGKFVISVHVFWRFFHRDGDIHPCPFSGYAPVRLRHGIQISVKNVRFTLLDIITLAY